MSKSTLNFWIIFAVSLILSAIVISVFFKIIKAILVVILILALAPVIYILLRLAMPGKKPEEGEKLKTRH